MYLDWEYTITRCDNGFIVRWLEDIEEADVLPRQQVFEAEEFDEWAFKEAFVRCLHCLADSFGLQGSKHDAKRIKIELADTSGE